MIPESSLESARAALERYVDPYLGQSLAAVQAVREVRADGGGSPRASRSATRWAATWRS